VAAVVRLFRLGHQSLWIDEQFTLTSAGLPGHFAWPELLDNVHGPLHALAVAVAASLGGTSEWVLRLPSALAGIAMVPVMAWLAARFVGRDAAVPAAWLTAGSPFLVWYSQEARNYAFLMLAAAGSTGLLLEFVAQGRLAIAARYALVTAAGLLSNLSFLLLVPFHLRQWLAPGPTRRLRLRALAVVAGVSLLVVLPWLPSIGGIWDWSRLTPGRAPAAGEQALRGTTTFHVAAVPFAIYSLLVGYAGGPSLRELRADATGALTAHLPEVLAAAVVFGLLLVLGLRTLARRGRLADTLLWLVAPALVVSYFAANNFKVFNPRYLAVSLPCVLLVLAAAFAALGPRARLGFGTAVALLWMLSLGRMAFDPAYGRDDYRAALAHVRAGFLPGERVLAVGAPEPVEWYGRGLPVARWWLGFAAVPERMASRLQDSLAVVPGTWIVCSRSEDLDPEGRFARWLDERVAPAERMSASGVRVWHWRQDAARDSARH